MAQAEHTQWLIRNMPVAGAIQAHCTQPKSCKPLKKFKQRMKIVEDYCPYDKKDWRKWLELNHKKKDAVWLILYKKKNLQTII